MIQQAAIVVSVLMGAKDARSHVTAHGIAPIFPHWNIIMPFGDSAHGFWFTNHLLMSLVAAVVMLLVFVPIGRRYQAAMAGVPVTKNVPTGFMNMIEGMMEGLRTAVVKPVLAEDTDRFMPFLWTLFFYILTCNLLGLVPLDSFATFLGAHHIGGTPTGNVNITAGLALCAFAMIHYSGVRQVFEQLVAGTYGSHHHEESSGSLDEHGHEHEAHDHAHPTEPMAWPLALAFSPTVYLWNFAPHAFQVEKPRRKPGIVKRILMLLIFVPVLAIEYRFFAMLAAPIAADGAQWTGVVLGFAYAINGPGLHILDLLDSLMWGFFVILEAIGALVKPFALCIRLFANMVAGHIVIASLLMLIPAVEAITAGYMATSLTVAVGCVLMSCLELFVAFLQAFIFMFLSAIFIGAAVHPQH
jgi:F0F1-type ATP synthase membrane subunit a